MFSRMQNGVFSVQSKLPCIFRLTFMPASRDNQERTLAKTPKAEKVWKHSIKKLFRLEDVLREGRESGALKTPELKK